MEQIKLLKDWQSKKKGEILNISKGGADSAIQAQVAEYFNPQKHTQETIQEIVDNQIHKEMVDKRIIKISSVSLDKEAKKIISEFYGKGDLARKLLDVQPLYYDKSKTWWAWDNIKLKWYLVDETDIFNFVDELSYANTINSTEKNEIIESLKQQSRKRRPIPMRKTWVQFKDIVIDVTTGEEFKADPKYFVTNPIPWQLHPERFMATPNLDRILEEWVGKDYVYCLKQIISYCLLPDYPINRMFCFIGAGMNGKSKFLELLNKFLGDENVTSSEFDLLINSRFEKTRLHRKLACVMGETNFNEMSKTSILKKLTGKDKIGFEYKNKDVFDDYNYAKILIATNNLPTTTDKTIGFYRRWLIVDFPNQFSEKKDILAEIPDEEYEALAVNSLIILKGLLDKREFDKEGTIEDRAKKYEEKSDFVQKFINDFTKLDGRGYITVADFHKKFNEWCLENKYRQLSDTSLSMKIKDKGIEQEKKFFQWLFDGKGGQIRTWIGISWK